MQTMHPPSCYLECMDTPIALAPSHLPLPTLQFPSPPLAWAHKPFSLTTLLVHEQCPSLMLPQCTHMPVPLFPSSSLPLLSNSMTHTIMHIIPPLAIPHWLPSPPYSVMAQFTRSHTSLLILPSCHLAILSRPPHCSHHTPSPSSLLLLPLSSRCHPISHRHSPCSVAARYPWSPMSLLVPSLPLPPPISPSSRPCPHAALAPPSPSSHPHPHAQIQLQTHNMFTFVSACEHRIFPFAFSCVLIHAFQHIEPHVVYLYPSHSGAWVPAGLPMSFPKDQCLWDVPPKMQRSLWYHWACFSGLFAQGSPPVFETTQRFSVSTGTLGNQRLMRTHRKC